jgi:hypothetical protein
MLVSYQALASIPMHPLIFEQIVPGALFDCACLRTANTCAENKPLLSVLLTSRSFVRNPIGSQDFLYCSSPETHALERGGTPGREEGFGFPLPSSYCTRSIPRRILCANADERDDLFETPGTNRGSHIRGAGSRALRHAAEAVTCTYPVERNTPEADRFSRYDQQCRDHPR